MLIKRTRGWELGENRATPESVYLQRRSLVKAMGLGAASLALPAIASAQDKDKPSAALYPAKRNDKYGVPTPMTAEKLATTYNNFYEFGTDKSIWRDAQKLEVGPGPSRSRAWSRSRSRSASTIFWPRSARGARLPPSLRRDLVDDRAVERLSDALAGRAVQAHRGAKFVVMKTLSKPAVMREQRDPLYPWPYTEGLAMDEAMNDLTFIATGLYGKPIHKQNGAPLRLVAPWKYGFKNVKSIVSVEFSDKRPVSFWEKLQASEYGFWANVNPQVPHPRWSQATEKPLGSDQRIPTLLYNGYGEFVAGLYADRKAEKLFI